MRLSCTLPNSVSAALWVLHVLKQAITIQSKLKSRRQAGAVQMDSVAGLPWDSKATWCNMRPHCLSGVDPWVKYWISSLSKITSFLHKGSCLQCGQSVEQGSGGKQESNRKCKHVLHVVKEESTHPLCIIALTSLHPRNRRCGFKTFLDLKVIKLTATHF